MAIKDLSVEDVTKGLINQGDAGLAGRFLNNVNNGSLTQAAQNAGVTDTQVTPSIDVSELGTTQVEDLPADSVSSIEGQIRALAGIQSTPEIDNIENILSAVGQGTADLQIEAGNLPKEQAELKAQAGIPEFQKQQRDVMAQMAQLQAQLTSDLELITEQNRQEGGLAFASAGERGRRARQAAAEMAGLNAVNQALQGNIATAQQAINTQMEIKYGAIEGQLNAQKTLIEMNESRMNRAEKRLADQRQTEINLAMNKLEGQRELDRSYMQFVTSAVGVGRISASTGAEIMKGISNGDLSKLALIPTPVSESGLLEEALKEAETEQQEVDKALAITRTIDELKNHPALGAATGPLGARLPSLKTLTGETTEFAAIHEQLVNSLTLENLDLMSGVLSETDIKILSGAATRLRRDMSKEAYVRELNNLQNTFKRTINKYGTTPEQDKFFFNLDESDLEEINQVYPQTTPSTTFDPAEFYNN